MTTTKELNSLITKARTKGATVNVTTDSDGYISAIQVSGLKGCGPSPMSAISAAERLRELV